MARALTALTIGPLHADGRDGVVADIRAFSALGLHAAAVVTRVGALSLHPDDVASQLQAVLERVRLDAVKLTCPADAGALVAIAAVFDRHAVQGYLLDPAGAVFDPAALEVLTARLLPVARIIVVSVAEAQVLSGRVIDGWDGTLGAARAIAALGPAAVVIKAAGRGSAQVTDLLFDGTDYRDFTAERVATSDVTGAATTFAAALAATLAKGEPVQHSVAAAKAYVTKALQGAYDLGGTSSLHHFYRYWQPSAPEGLAPDRP